MAAQTEPVPPAAQPGRRGQDGQPSSQSPSGHVKSPLVALAGCFALGIFLVRPERSGAATIPWFLVSAAACLLAGLLLLRAGWLWPSLLLALSGFVFAGAAAAQLFELRFPPHHIRYLEALGVDLNAPVLLEGRVISTPQRIDYGLQFDLEAQRAGSGDQNQSVGGKVRLRLQTHEDPELSSAAGLPDLHYGDSIRVLARLRRPRTYQNPGSFDFRRRMASIEDLYWVGTIKNPSLIEKLPRLGSHRVSTFLERTRQRLLGSIDRLYPPWSAQGRYGAVLKAILWGDRSSLDSETIENFRKTGLYHLLVIAGLHVGLLALLAGFLLRPLPLGQTAKSALVLVFLLAYVSLVELRAPTLRATIMISAYLLARLVDRERSGLNAVGLAALLLLLSRPAWLFESGFQFSFSAALLIVGLAVPILERTTEPYRRALWRLGDEKFDDALAPQQAQFRLDLRATIDWLSAVAGFWKRHPDLAAATVTAPVRAVLWVVNILLFSAILQLGLVLPMVEVFHRVTFAGVALNAVAVPVMTLLLALAVPTVVLGTLAPALALWPAKALAAVLATLFFFTDWQRLPGWLSFRVPGPPLWVACGFALSVVVAGCALGRLRRTFWAAPTAAAIFLALIAVHPFPPRLPSGILEVTALDCGQGDALFLVLPDRTTMLMDAGGSRLHSSREGAFQRGRWDPGEDIVSPYLWSRGIRRIDILVLSHAHEDHLGGFAAVVENFEIGEFWHGENGASASYQALLDRLEQRRIPIRTLARGDRMARGGASVRVLWPPPGPQTLLLPPNDESLVMQISDGSASILLPGDVSRKVEKELLASASPLQSQVLKVAHHGSKSASGAEFLAQVAPRIALITSEYRGPGNLPNPEILDRLRAAGARVFRTDLDGAITVEMKGSSLLVRGYGALAGDSTVGEAATSSTGAGALNVR